MLLRRVIHHQLGDHPDATPVRCVDEALHIVQRAVVRMHPAVIGNVVAVIEQGRRIERQQPDRADPEFGDVIEL